MNDIPNFLQEKGLKKTTLRVSILEVFFEKKEPLTIVELEHFLAVKNVSANQTSLYRQIETLTEHNVLQSVMLKNSTAHYELQTHHHHHFICDSCDGIECIDDNVLESCIHSLERRLIGKGMSISSHQFSFHGQCKKCS